MKLHLRWLPDEKLVRRTLSGNRDAFDILVDRHIGTLHALAWSHTGSPMDADDVTQEAFLRAFTRLDTLRDANKFVGWIAGIVRNLATDLRAKSQRTVAVSPEILEALPAPAKIPDEDEIYAVVREAVLSLEEPAREVLCLHYFAGQSMSEIAQLQAVSMDAAYKRMQRAREALGRELLERMDGTPALKRRALARKRAILAALSGTPLAWQAAAGTGATSAVGLISAALLVAALGACGAAYVYRDVLADRLGYGVTATAPTAPPVPAEVNTRVPPAAASATPSASLPGGAAGVEGRFHGVIHDINSRPIAGARVRAELIDWKRGVFPPENTFVREAVTGADGTYELTGLKMGVYGLFSSSDDAADAGRDVLAVEEPDRRLDAYLKPARPIAGRVVNAAGAAVPGAVLVPEGYGPLGPIRNHAAAMAGRMVTNDRGEFGKGLYWSGDWSFRVQARGYAPTLLARVEAGAQNLKVQLDAAATLRGHVRSKHDGQPAPGEVVKLRGNMSDREATTDAEGFFEFTEVELGTVQLQIASDAAVLVAGGEPLIMEAGATREVELLLGTGGTISGSVIDEATGEGIPDVGVRIVRQARVDDKAPIDFRQQLRTDATGSFFLPVCPFGHYEIQLSASPGYIATDSSPREIIVSDVREYAVRIPLQRGWPLGGQVIDGTGTPSPTEIFVVAIDAEGQSYATKTSEGGRFELTIRPSTTSVDVIAGEDTRRSEWLRAVALSPEGRNDISLHLDVTADCTVEVEVDIAANDPRLAARGLEVRLEPEDRTPFALRFLPLGRRGKHTIENVLPGRYRAVLAKRDHERPMDTTEPFDVAPGQMASGVQLAPPKPGGLTAAGQVVDEEGVGIPEAGLIAANQDARTTHRTSTDAEGYFAFDDLSPGRHAIIARRAPYLPDMVEVAVGLPEVPEAAAEGLQLTLTRTVVFQGQALDAATGAPLDTIYASAFLAIDPETSVENMHGLLGVASLFSKHRSLGEGFFEMDLREGRYLLIVVADGYAPKGIMVECESTQEAPVHFALERGITVSGTVRSPDGTPLAGARISELEPGTFDNVWSRRSVVSSDIDGSFRLAALATGTPLYVSHPGYTTQIVKVLSGEDLEISMRLKD